MRTIILTLLLGSGFVWSLTSGFRAILVFNWVTFFRPQDFDWSFWTTKPLFQISSFFVLAANLIHKRYRMKFTPFLLLYLLFFFWIVMSCVQAFDQEISWTYFKMFFLPFPFLFLILTGSLRSLKEMKLVLWVMAGSVGFVAFKTGLVFTMKGGGHITDQINGFVGDNNVLAQSICLTVACLMGLRNTLPKSNRYRIPFFIIMSQVIMTILYTKSRGGFITMGTFLFLGAAGSNKKFRNVAILLSLAVLGYFFLPEDLFSRLGTLQNVEEDSSSMGRVMMWQKALLQASMRPFFGVGVGGFPNFNIAHWPADFVDGRSLVTHSVYFQVLATMGWGGLSIYMAIILTTVWNLHMAYRLAQKYKAAYPSVSWVHPTAYWMRNGFLSYMIGSGFLDMLVYDVPWYFMLYSSLLYANLKSEIGKLKRKPPIPKSPTRGPVADPVPRTDPEGISVQQEETREPKSV